MTIDPTMPVVVPWITAFQFISIPRILSTAQRKGKFCRGLAVLSRRNCWLTFAALPIPSRSAIQPWDAVVPIHSNFASATFRTSLPGGRLIPACLLMPAISAARAGSGRNFHPLAAHGRRVPEFRAMSTVAEIIEAVKELPETEKRVLFRELDPLREPEASRGSLARKNGRWVLRGGEAGPAADAWETTRESRSRELPG
jgi:hypothetical protein